jgi:hypothetical protein
MQKIKKTQDLDRVWSELDFLLWLAPSFLSLKNAANIIRLLFKECKQVQPYENQYGSSSKS